MTQQTVKALPFKFIRSDVTKFLMLTMAIKNGFVQIMYKSYRDSITIVFCNGIGADLFC